MEKITNNISMGAIEGTNGLFRIVEFKDNNSWAVFDKFGNNVSGFLQGFPIVIPYASNRVVALGFLSRNNEKKGKRSIKRVVRDLYSSSNNPDDYKSREIHFSSPVTYAAYVNPTTLVFSTEQGACFVESGTYKLKSDFYNTLQFDSSPRVKSWVYKKDISNGRITTTLTGTITPEGEVSPQAFDSFFNRVRKIDVNKEGEMRYDVIDDTSIIEELNERAKTEAARMSNGLKKALINKK